MPRNPAVPQGDVLVACAELRDPGFTFEVQWQRSRGGVVQQQGSWSWPIVNAQDRAAQHTAPSGMWRVPADVVAGLERRLAQSRSGGDGPVWLRIEGPAHRVSAVAWEQSLVPALGRPLLRWTGGTGVAVRPPGRITVAVLAVEKQSAEAARRLAATVRTVLTGSARADTRVVVVSPASAELPPDLAGDARVQFRSPPAPGPNDLTAPQSPHPLEGTWLHRAATALMGLRVDVVHVLGLGGGTPQWPMLLAPASWGPPGQGSDNASDIGTAAFAAWLSTTGAWGCVFASPPAAPESRSLRHVAAAVAHARPGFTLYATHLPAQAPGLADWYRFISTDGPCPVPLLANGFAYVPPDLVPQDKPASTPAPTDRFVGQAGLWERRIQTPAGAPAAAPPPDLPDWACIAHQYLAEAAAAAATTRMRSKDAAAASRDAAAQRTLRRLRAIVDDVTARGRPEGA